MAEYYTKAESDARYAGTSHTHALESLGGNNLPADRVEVPESVCGSFDNAYTLDEALDSIADQLGGKAPTNHTHSGYAAADHSHSGYAPAEHTHTADEISGLPAAVDAYSKTESDARYAGASHTHDGYMTEDDAADAFAGINHSHTPASIGAAAASHTHDYAASNHTHSEFLTENEAADAFAPVSHTHNYAPSGHTHTASDVGAAPASHTHNYAPTGHTHTASDVGAAAANHGHTGYADEDHTHTAADVGAVPASGGTVNGALTITGAGTIRGKAYTQQILPMDGGSYSIGSSDNRYYSTYLRVNPNVSSDRRCKRDIEAMDINALAAFVGKLSVVNYNYNDDAADEAKRIGLIAQDVVAADPTIAQGCIEQDEKGFYSLRAADLVFPLIAAVQALTKRVEELEGK